MTINFTLFDELVTGAVHTQKLWDRHHEIERQKFGEVLAPFASPRFQVQTMTLSARVAFSSEREQDFRLNIFPLNLGLDLRTGSSASHESRISMTIEQIPIHRAPTPDANDKT